MDEPLTAWTIDRQQQETNVTPAGGFAEGVTVYFTTGKGNHGSVFVPLTDYNVSTVRVRVNDAAARMDAVSQLTGG